LDPVCHTLVGLTLARSGLARWTARGTATLVIAANLPDVDVLAIGLGRNLEVRRGWTHGVLALVVWPFLLAGAMLLWDRYRRLPNREAAQYGALALLSAIGVVTHPFLDYLNNYGLRWLMPFQDRWFYGDSLFIVDPWLLGLLAAGILLSRRRERAARGDSGRPARLALAGAAVYVGLMMVSTSLARIGVAADLARSGLAGARFMATAAPVNPFVKEVVVDDGRRYRLGRYRLLSAPRLRFDSALDKGVQYAAAVDQGSPRAKAFFHWSRFPVLEPVDSAGTRFRAYDLRYVGRGGSSWAAIPITPATPSGSH